MPVLPKSHPDRSAATLANIVPAAPGRDDFAAPGAGAADCRIDLKLLQWRALAALARSERARSHLGELTAERHPDLWAGTVRDGVARGFAARLEECVALAGELPDPDAPPPLGETPRVTAGKELRKKKDLLVASGGARVRFSRKQGLLFVDRDDGLNVPNCLGFEARVDRGTLDGFEPDPAERARLFSPQFLQPRRYVEGELGTELVLTGRLGRGPIGWDCELTVTGVLAEPTLRLGVRIDNRTTGWRLRARFLLPSEVIVHHCTAVREVVHNDAGGFVAFTLVRSCATLRGDDDAIATPGASCQGPLEHWFRLGSAGARP